MFACKFETTNAAFGDPEMNEDVYEIARILREIADGIERDQRYTDVIRDANGNKIGRYDCPRGDIEPILTD